MSESVSIPSSVNEGTGTEASTRVAEILLSFLVQGERGVTDISRDLGLSKSVVHRVLRSLVSRGLVEQDPDGRRYRLGAAAAALGARALGTLDLREVTLPILRKLAAASGETATVSTVIGRTRVYLDQVLSHQAIRMQVELGVAFPLHAGASSRVILAFSDRAFREEIVWRSTLDRITPLTPTDPQHLWDSLSEIRKQHFATSIGERQPDAASVAAPVFDAKAEVVGAISVCGPSSRFDYPAMQRLAGVVRGAAEQASRQLGWQGTSE